MKVKFANGVVKQCSAPTEQKRFNFMNGETVNAGWILILRLFGEITSAELDELFTEDNMASLEFLTETESGEDKTLFTLKDYCKVSSSTIRHAEDEITAFSEIQLTKGV